MGEEIEVPDRWVDYIEDNICGKFALSKKEAIIEILRSALIRDPLTSIFKPYRFVEGTYPHQRARQRKEWKENREKKLKEKCEICGSAEDLSIHHEDELAVNYFELWLETQREWAHHLIERNEKLRKKAKEIKENPKHVVERCPECGNSNINERKTKEPPFVCYECGFEFDEPEKTNKEFEDYKRGLARRAIREYGGSVSRTYFEKVEKAVEDYVAMEDVKTLCKSCHEKIEEA